jgi:hypothetical protein
MFNIEASLQEENINAANQAAYLSNLNLQRNNLATMIGEYGRDVQLRKANEEYNSLFLDNIKDMFSGLTYDPNTRKWIPTGQGIASDNTSVYDYSPPKINASGNPEYDSVDLEDPTSVYGNSYYRGMPRYFRTRD